VTIQENKASRGPYWKTWLKFMDKCNQFDTLDVESWTEYQFLGYIISKTGLEVVPVESNEDSGYQFSKATSPSRHPHLQNLRRLIGALHKMPGMPKPTEWDRQRVKQFIDYCIKNQTNQIFSIKYWNNEHMLAAFHRYLNKNLVIDRSTELPEPMQNITPYVMTYGDLAHCRHMEDFDFEPYIQLGLNVRILETIL